MKEILVDYVHYNVWANAKVIELLLPLSDTALDADLNSSFSTIRKTVHHVWGAESIWQQRLHMAEHVIHPSMKFDGTFTEACAEWQQVSGQLVSFTEKQFDDRGFEHEFAYQNLKGDQMKSKVWEALHHCMNHSTFHRGQLIHFLRLSGVDKIPSTDFINYCRERK